MSKSLLRRFLSTSFAVSTIAATTLLTSTSSLATIVEFQTSHGNFQVNLYDERTPVTVSNFLSYVNDGTYTNTVIHRVVKNFIVQGGGYTYGGEGLLNVVKKPAIVNEPIFSNVTGTIAMAKTSDPNSATNQWFFNLKNNSQSLDVKANSGGFTVFGQVIGDGMEVINDIAGLPLCSSIPIAGLDNCQTTPGAENFVTVSAITIVDSSSATAANLNPVPNTLINKSGSGSSSGGGGSTTWLSLIALSIFSLVRRKIKAI
ncbi:MAG: peptidylprolyl isomerase [Alteromonadaceae bacterium]|nr:peptidylprolyl isomerase [Alteromonadaceae bacterium]